MSSTSYREVALAVLGDDTGPLSEAHWHELVSGGFVLLDQFDRDGRRYLIAVRQSGNAWAAPTPRERRVLARRARGDPLKLIAADLGVSIPTVSRALQSGMQKLGLRTQSELSRVFGTHGAQSAA